VTFNNGTGQVAKTCPVNFFDTTYPNWPTGSFGGNARSLLQQVGDGMVIMLRSKGHTHLAGDVGGIVPVIGLSRKAGVGGAECDWNAILLNFSPNVHPIINFGRPMVQRLCQMSGLPGLQSCVLVFTCHYNNKNPRT
jgi:hypothetical protein